MSYNLKGITLKIGADITGLEKSLSKIKAETAGLDKTMNNLKKSMKFDPKLETEYRNLSVSQELLATKIGSVSKQWNAASQQVIKQEATLKSLKQQMAAVDTSTAEGRKQARALQKDYDALSQSTMAVKAKEQALHNQLIELQNGFISTDAKVLKTYSSMAKLERVTESLSQKTKLLSLASAGALTAAGAAAISFEDAFTGVTKTVNGTPAQLAKIDEGIKHLAVTTSSSYETIAHYAELAGQMGVPTKAIVGFTKTITELGDTTNLVGDEAAQSLAKFSNIMVSQEKKTNSYYSRLGSTIVDLGNKFATTEKDISEMSIRLAVAGKQVGFNSNQVLGLSTALSSLGIKAAAGGGSISKMLKRIQLAVSTGNDDLQKFAQVSGMTSEEFQKAWGENAAGAFLKFVQGIGKSGDVTKTLNDLGITEIRQAQAMGALAQSSDVLERALNTSATAWSNNSAMANEAQKRYATMKSQLIEAWEAIKQAFASLGQSMAPTITSIAKGVKNVALSFTELSDGTKRTIGNVLLFTATLSPALKITSKFAGGVQGVLGFMGRLGSRALTTASNMKAVAQTMETVNDTTTLTTKAMLSGANGMTKLGTAIFTAQKYIVPVTLALTALGVAIVAVAEKQEKALEKTRENMRENDALYESIMRVSEGYDTYKSSIDSAKSEAESILSSYEQQSNKTNVLMNTIEQLTGVESLNNAQKAVMKDAVNQLNEIYPEMNLKIDEASGKLIDENGQIVTNVEKLKAQAEQLRETAKAQADYNAYLSLSSAYVQQQAETKALNDALLETEERYSALMKKVQKGTISKSERSELAVLSEDAKSLREKLSDSREELDSTGRALDALGQTAQAVDFDSTLKQKLSNLQSTAKEFGFKIPKSLADAIKSGKGDVNSATEYLNATDAYTKMIAKAERTGTNIPKRLANGILNNAPTLQNQIEAMNTLTNFQSMVTKAEKAGTDIPLKTATGMISSMGTFTEQINAMNALMSFQEAVTKAGIDGSLISDNLIQGIITGANGGENGVSIDEATQRIKDAADFKEMADKADVDSKQAVDNIVKQLLNGEITVDEAAAKLEKMEKHVDKDGKAAEKSAKKYSDATGLAMASGAANATNSGNLLGSNFYNAVVSWVASAASFVASKVQEMWNAITGAKEGAKNSKGSGGGSGGGGGGSWDHDSAVANRISRLPSYISAEYALPEIRTVNPFVAMASGIDSLSPRRMAMYRAATGAAVQVATATVSSIPTSLNYGNTIGTSNSYGLYGLLKNISNRLNNIETRTDELERPLNTTVHVVSVLDGDKVSDTVIEHIERIASREDKSRGGS